METNRSGMTAIYDQEVDVISQAQIRAIKLANIVANRLAQLPWLLALLPIFFFGLVYSCVMYLPILMATRKVTRLTDALLSEIANIPERDAMILHSDIEEITTKLEMFVSGARSFFIFHPLVLQLTRALYHYKRAEKALFNIAYPHHNKPLTENQYEAYLKSFQAWRDAESHLEVC